MARDHLSARSAKWLANPPPMCQFKVPPLRENVAAQAVGMARWTP